MLNIESLSKKYGSHIILDSLSFSIHPGEIVGVVGENGAGKSTLLKMLATLLKPTSGKVSLQGYPYNTNVKKIRKLIGYVPQEIAIWDEFTVEENMTFFEKLSPVNKTKDELHQICLDMKLDKWHIPVKKLSGGMKRKLNMAISLIHDPEVLFLDEPTVGIDLKSKSEISTYLHNLAKTKNVIILFTSHDMDEIINLCDRILCIGEDPYYQQILSKAGINPYKL